MGLPSTDKHVRIANHIEQICTVPKYKYTKEKEKNRKKTRSQTYAMILWLHFVNGCTVECDCTHYS